MAFLSQKVSHRVYAKCFSYAPPDLSNLGFFLLEQPFRRTQFATFNKLIRNVTKRQLSLIKYYLVQDYLVLNCLPKIKQIQQMYFSALFP